MEADFRFAPRKVLFSIVGVSKLGLFVKQLSKREIESWAQHPT
jgi:hypothetical protein